MALTDDIKDDNVDICEGPFTVSRGYAIPSIQDLPLAANQGRQLRLVALFVDVRKSTQLVAALGLVRAARMYKAYMRGISSIIRERGGELLSFNGDGIAAGFVGDDASTAACLSALNLSWFLGQVLKPRVDNTLIQLGADPHLVFDFGIGVELGDVVVVRGGIRGEERSDLVWAGNPLNYAVKLSGLSSLPYSVYVSNDVMNLMHVRLWSNAGEQFWEAYYWPDRHIIVWRSNWWMRPDLVANVPTAGNVLRRLLPPP